MVDEMSNDTNIPTNEQNKSMEKVRVEYFTKLEKWLQEAYAWQSVAAMFPYYLMSGQLMPQTTGNINTSLTSNTQSSVPGDGTPGRQNNEPNRGTNSGNTQVSEAAGRPEGFEYHIPPIWKRFVAELIDSVLIFVLKLIITFVALDISDAMNMEPYTLDTLQTSLQIVDYKMAMEIASKILIWEMMHRFTFCIIEALWLQHGVNGRIGGATPGKTVMGLRVVKCRSITPVNRNNNDEVVLVSPGTDLGLPLALGRSIVKNLIMTLLFPICFSLFSFRFNRTGYDLACDSIVVEDPYRNQNNNRPHRQ
ncbi:hypothetical protein PV325_009482 [Microctonus aethiopoides]|uniref:RDD domain-containing protein n=1 Tax=Microctonus aethiopoides TaxID=144406 RepID=A0AA39C633_9HYME|nr:hypothetical protein PV325_009482 [Microctonus aethiopoides]KAK0158572.1 hypothetical protein PV328_009555 [Microctonus aethiopoides]